MRRRGWKAALLAFVAVALAIFLFLVRPAVPTTHGEPRRMVYISIERSPEYDVRLGYPELAIGIGLAVLVVWLVWRWIKQSKARRRPDLDVFS